MIQEHYLRIKDGVFKIYIGTKKEPFLFQVFPVISRQSSVYYTRHWRNLIARAPPLASPTSTHTPDGGTILIKGPDRPKSMRLTLNRRVAGW